MDNQTSHHYDLVFRNMQPIVLHFQNQHQKLYRYVACEKQKIIHFVEHAAEKEKKSTIHVFRFCHNSI